jgi:aminoglycoside 6'-N-acetyltransferase I
VAPEIKILHPNDRAVLDNVAPGVFDNALDSRLVAEFLGDERHHLVVAIDQGQVIGFASGVHYVHPDKSPELWINEVGVAPGHQGRGVGKAVMQALLQHGKSLGCGEAWVLTDRSNLAAMRLYASTGGQEAARDQVMFTFFMNAERTDSRQGSTTSPSPRFADFIARQLAPQPPRGGLADGMPTSRSCGMAPTTATDPG